MSQHQAICFMNGNIVEGPDGVSYDRQPVGGVRIPPNCTYVMLMAKLCRRFGIDTTQNLLQILHRYPVLLPNNTISNYFLIPIECEEDMENLNDFYLSSVELYLTVVPINDTAPNTTVGHGYAQIGDDLITRPSIGSSSPMDAQVAGPSHVSFDNQVTQDNPIELLLSNIPMTNVASDPFEDVDPYENIDLNQDVDEECLDEDSSSEEGDEEDQVEDDEAGAMTGDMAAYDMQAGPSTCPATLPPYIVPTAYTYLDMEAITQNSPMMSGFHDEHAVWDPRQEFRKGMYFKDKKALMDASKMYSMEVQREYKVTLSNTNTWVAKCKQGKEKCRWHIRGKNVQALGMWKVASYLGPHECFNESDSSKEGHSNLDCNIIAQLIKRKLTTTPSYSIAAIREDVKEKYNYTPSYRKCWDAKQKAMAMIYGDWDISYSLLPAWLFAVSRFCPGSLVDIRGLPLRDPREMMFDRAFWSFGPCIEAFMHCPPLLCIDATFMYGKYKEYVLIATTIDGNCHILPVAFAIVKNESADTWGWFLSFLVEIVKRRPERVALISDRHMGNKLSQSSKFSY